MVFVPVYQGEYLNEISFPLGGIGSGSVGLAGNGHLVDWDIFNRPAKGSLNGYTHIAVKAVDDEGNVFPKILQGDVTKNLSGQFMKGDYIGFGFGPSITTMAGFPHFKNVVFKGEFPIAELTFTDEAFPGIVRLTAFNPFIPLDSKNSSIPAAFFTVSVENNTGKNYRYTVAFSLQNPYEKTRNTAVTRDGCTGLFLTGDGVADDEVTYGDLSVFTDHPDSFVQTYWYRGGWQDGNATFWRDFNSPERLRPREYPEPGKDDMGTLESSFSASAGSRYSVRFVMAWNQPNFYNYWDPAFDSDGKHISWKNYYATVFPTSADSAVYSLNNFTGLYAKTKLFKDALFDTSLDPVILDAVSATLSVLKSPTTLRFDDGAFYGWEGVMAEKGSCEGSCTHVWNYNYALPFLFPDLERSMRDLEYEYNQFENGRMRFRLLLPKGTDNGWWDMPCVDGQMGGIFKIYREWKISGDSEWLRKIWPKAKRSLTYAWHPENPYRWDADKDGVLEGRQHHTLDMELYGPSAWLEGMYLAALKAAAEMAEFLGEKEDAAEYRSLFEQGKKWTQENLFNGSYYIQKIDVKDRSVLAPFPGTEERYWNEEAGEIKYQIADGCDIDQLCGQWHADLIGLGDIFPPDDRKKALTSLYRNNYKKTFRNFANPWRNFVLNDESGTVMCEYPEGTQKPAIPVPYCEETMHGFEYQLAGLFFSHGMIDEGVSVVRGIRERYDGKKRNPWNELECGSNYARSLASYGLIPIAGGFRFDMVRKMIGFDPKVTPCAFRSIFSVADAWGKVVITENELTLTLLGGTLVLNAFFLPFAKKLTGAFADGKEIQAEKNGDEVLLDSLGFERTLVFRFERK